MQGKRIPLLRRFPCKCNYVCFRLGHMLPHGINRGKGNYIWEMHLKKVASQNMLNVFISWPWKAVDHFCKPCTKRISSVLEGGRTQLLYKVALPDVHYYHYYIRTTPFSFPEPFSHSHSTFSVSEYGRCTSNALKIGIQIILNNCPLEQSSLKNTDLSEWSNHPLCNRLAHQHHLMIIRNIKLLY